MKNIFSLLIIILVVLRTSLSLGQPSLSELNSIQVPKNSVIFKNDNRNSFMVFPDSTYYFEYKIGGDTWRKHSYVFDGEISFKSFIHDYPPIATENGSVYFVDRGIGEVYKFINDTIKRIDNSFHHKNQYSGNLFSYKDTLYCFGGYGLFSHKNIITYYDENTGEWFLVKVPFNGEKPNPRAGSFFQLIDDKFYMGGGSDPDPFEDVWEFDLIQKKWIYLGEIAQHSLVSDFPLSHSNDLKKAGTHLYGFDFKENTLTRYDSPSLSIHTVLKDSNEKYLCISEFRTSTQNISVVLKKEFLLSAGNVSSLFVSKKRRQYYYSLYCWLLILPFLGVICFFSEKETGKKRNQIMKTETFQCLSGRYYFNGVLLRSSFGPIEEEVLINFLKAESHSLELSELYPIFDYDNPTIDTIKKRRENVLKSIREKVFSNSSTDQFFIESKSLLDRRVKVLTLNPKLMGKGLLNQ